MTDFYNARCIECNQNPAEDYDLYIEYNRFSVCFKCKNKNPDLFKRIPKSTVQKEYLLSDADIGQYQLVYIEKPNPRLLKYSPMKLFLRYQVQQVAIEKYKSLQDLEKEKTKRKNAILLKRESNYEKRLKELKRASIGTDAIQLTSSLKKHEHKFEQISSDESCRSKCTICGLIIYSESF